MSTLQENEKVALDKSQEVEYFKNESESLYRASDVR